MNVDPYALLISELMENSLVFMLLSTTLFGWFLFGLISVSRYFHLHNNGTKIPSGHYDVRCEFVAIIK